MEQLKSSIIGELDTRRDGLSGLSRKIHAHPELGLQETQAATWLTGYLEENGFTVERNFCKLPTAFRCQYGQGKPTIAILAEYDALPEIGHACGHNLIAAMAVGAAVAAKPIIEKFGGAILVIGTPAEEMQGGKAIIADQGGFNDLDVAMMVHPGTADTAITKALAAQALDVEFFGKEAHAAACPESGVNALEAMLLSFAAVNSLRQHTRGKARIHGIITDGGSAANIVPAHSAGNFLVRAEDNAYLDELKEKVLACFAGAATATGARLEYRWAKMRYAPLRTNFALARLFSHNMEQLGRQVNPENPAMSFGSSDMGNVSQLVPSIHPFVAIAASTITIHSREFAEAAASDEGLRGLLDGAKAMAMTVADLITEPANLETVQDEFKGR